MADTTCWVLTNSDGEDLDQDGIPHFPSEKHAEEEAAKIEGDEVFKPRQLDHPCVIVACSCCEYIYDEDEDGVCHFDNLAEAEQALAGHWKFTRDEALCDECKPGTCDRSADEHGSAEALFLINDGGR
ncbi:hypothetical protein AB0F17_08590 [Nonomuraea sp. NPDC026600]|uniref:hypothetical protein n=1 Tax=Nonomuraea sp. NPDC026600 TaxID=3155363 RepID=UPI0033DC5DE6